MVDFPTQIPKCDCHRPALLDLFLSSDASFCSTMAFTPLGSSDHAVVSVFMDFPSYEQRDAPFYHISYDYSCDHLRDVPWEDIFKLSASTAASEFCERVQVELMYIPVVESIRSILSHLHGFQLLLLLPEFIEKTFLFVPKG